MLINSLVRLVQLLQAHFQCLHLSPESRYDGCVNLYLFICIAINVNTTEQLKHFVISSKIIADALKIN